MKPDFTIQETVKTTCCKGCEPVEKQQKSCCPDKACHAPTSLEINLFHTEELSVKPIRLITQNKPIQFHYSFNPLNNYLSDVWNPPKL